MRNEQFNVRFILTEIPADTTFQTFVMKLNFNKFILKLALFKLSNVTDVQIIAFRYFNNDFANNLSVHFLQLSSSVTKYTTKILLIIAIVVAIIGNCL